MRQLINHLHIIFFLLLLTSCATQNQNGKNEGITIENKEFSLIIGHDGTALSLKHKPTGQECLQTGINISAFTLTQYRPYDNELQLSYPSKPKTFSADTVYWDGGDLIVGFHLERNTARIGVEITDNYIGFKLKGFDYDFDDFREKRKTEVDEFTFLQLPVRKRKNFGEWLNVSWDDDVAVNLLGTGTETKIDAESRDGYHIFKAGADAEVKMEGVGAALIVTSKANLLTRIANVEQDFELPNGVKSRSSEEYKYSYYECIGINPQNADKHIAYARQGGFHAIVINYSDFAVSLGHFPWRPEYPGGMEDLKIIVKKIHAAGMVPGFHIHYNKVMKNDPYVTPDPDPRLNLSRIFTLNKTLDLISSTINVEENPSGCTMEEGRRFLKIGKELIEYESYITTAPYKFTGCKRGMLGTKAYACESGSKFGLLDVDTWNIFVRIDQRTSLQKEMAERISNITNEAGFRFVYFDGAEDVHPPYWFNIANAQYEVYKRMIPEILFAEGAAKAHFSWHILTRGNAFDTFSPEIIKDAIRRYQATEANFVANDFSAINFGWVNNFIPDDKSIGMQPDMYEFVWSRAAAWDCPVSMFGSLRFLDAHPRVNDNLEAIRRWEEARIQGFFTKTQKEQLKNLNQEHTLLLDEKGQFELQPCHQITGMPLDSSPIRSFEFERNGKVWVVYWHTYGQSDIVLEVDPSGLKLYKEIGKEIEFRTDNNKVILPSGERHYLETNLSREKVEKAFKNCQLK